MKSLLTMIAALMFLVAAHRALASGVNHQTTSPSAKVQMMNPPQEAAPRSFTCKFHSGDVGTIVGVGASRNAAHADAAEKCFDRRVSLYESVRGQKVDMDRGQLLIDACVNLTCS
ncbi:MAG: hypothetical protein H6624_04155 [Bdellovibrionaceae bacterium]|nr:hypothetical protein [Bdellovibrionales bacterium]MCB9083508.1 hypothetical protein [Pseudobdellovibrionaceae bacterium]